MCPFDGNPTSYAAPVQPKVLPTAPLAKAKVDPDAEVRAVLLKAADRLEQLGWFGHLNRPESCLSGGGRECLGIAVERAAGGIHHQRFWRALGFSGNWEVVEWNNHPARTLPEVINKLRNPQ